MSSERPLAYLHYTDGYNSQVEVIDILESVRNDATNIGHPAIVFAIDHWQRLLIWEKYSRKDDINSDYEILRTLQFMFTDIFLDSARKNLKAIGNAMLEGSRRHSIPKEIALDLKMEGLNQKDTYLYVAWKRLKKKHIVETEERSERIERIEKYLGNLYSDREHKIRDEYEKYYQKHGIINTIVSIETTIAFLKTKGSKYVYSEHSSHSQRRKWIVFKNDFIGWYFKKKFRQLSNTDALQKRILWKKSHMFQSASASIVRVLIDTNMFGKQKSRGKLPVGS